MNVDFKKVLGLNHKIGGFISYIASPKATRTFHKDTGHYSYSLHHEDVLLENEEGYTVNKKGLYQIVDICHWGGESDLTWNIYLVVVSDEGVYPVAEYLDSPETLWVKEARHIVKAYFDGEELDTIELTPEPEAKKLRKGFNKYMNKPARSITKKEATASDRKKDTSKKKDENSTSKPLQKEKPEEKPAPKKAKKKATGRSQETTPLKQGEARLMTFTGMIIGVYPIKRHNSKYIEIDTDKGTLRFSRETNRQVNVAEGKERYANKIEYKLKNR